MIAGLAFARPIVTMVTGTPTAMRRHAALTVLAALLALLAPGTGRAGEEDLGQDLLQRARWQMVEEQIVRRGVVEPRVVAAMREVPRHRFLPESAQDEAYGDTAVPIGDGQHILQPYLVALMADLLELSGDERVLEIGTGTGYQAAVLSRLAGQVYTVEIVGELSRRAAATLASLGYDNVHVRVGDGYQGWPQEAPFDAILLTAAVEKPPGPLLDQLAMGGRAVMPIGAFFQDLVVFVRTPDGIERRKSIPVRLEPMTGAVREER